MKHAALYCRISQANGHADKIEDQERWGREYAAQTWPGLPVVTYADNDLSAARDDVIRPAFERLKAAIAAGQVAEVWAKEQSRLQRIEVRWFEFAALCAANGITKVHTRAQGIIDVGGVVAGIQAVLAAHEVRQLTQRINDRLDKLAAAGRPAGATPFGYRHAVSDEGIKTYAIVPEQAKAIRWAAERVLAGWSLSHIAGELRERWGLHGAHRVKVRDASGQVVTDAKGEPVTRPSTLTAGAVRNMLTKPAIAGHRVHRGVDLGPGTGNWEPILDEDIWQACRAKLGGTRTVQRSDGRSYVVGPAHKGHPPGRRYLLTGGLAVCGRCGAPMLGQVLQKYKGQPYLMCSRRKTKERSGACTGIMLTATEAHVVEALFAELDNPEFRAALAADEHEARRDELTAALAALDRQRAELAALWATPGELTTEEWRAARDGLAAQERKLRDELAALPPPPHAGIDGAREAWPHMTLDEQREFLRLFIRRVTIHPATPGRKGFDAGRVSIEYHIRRGA